MDLKKIEVFGFKSFKNKTVLEFRSPITGVAGPNGCGKSNIVDALMWAMGETAPKSLRGASLQDVIFSGSESQPPSPFAEVSLFLERGEDPFPGKYSQFTELVITRRAERAERAEGGESSCFINREPCRLKDIKELFISTGAGCRGFSVIEQESVEKLVTAKPLERRMIIEEAAGVAKFRSQKEESLRKLSLAQKNISRLEDILKEQASRLKALSRQMKDAEKYKTLKQEMRDREAELMRRAHEEIEASQLKADKAILSLEKSKEKAQGEKRELASQLKLSKKALEKIEGEAEKEREYLQALELKLLELKKEGEKKEEARQIRYESFKRHKEGRIELQREIAGLKSKLLHLQEALKDRRIRHKKEKKEMESLKGESSGWDRFQRLSRRGEEIESELKEHRKAAAALSLHLAKLKSKLEFLNEGLAQAAKESERADTEIKKTLRQKSAAEKARVELEKQKRGLNREKALKAKTAAAAIRAEAASESEKLALKNKLLACKIEESKKLIHHFESPNEGTVSLLKWKPGEFRPLVKSLSVDEGFEAALEAALDPYLYALLSAGRGGDEAVKAIDYLKRGKRGKASFLIRLQDEAPAKASLRKAQESLSHFPSVICFLDEKVKIPKEAEPLKRLAMMTAVVSNFAAALELKGRFPDFQFVTLDGDFINKERLAYGGSYENKTHVFEIKREIGSLQKNLESGAALSSAAEKKSERAARAFAKAENEYEAVTLKESALLKGLQELALKEEGFKKALLMRAGERERLEESLSRLKKEIRQCEKEAAAERKRFDEAEDVIQTKERISESLKERLRRGKILQEKQERWKMALFAAEKEMEMTERESLICKSALEKAKGQLADFIRMEAELSAQADRESSRLLELENERALGREELQERQALLRKLCLKEKERAEACRGLSEKLEKTAGDEAELEKGISKAALEKEKLFLQKQALSGQSARQAVSLEKAVLEPKYESVPTEELKQLKAENEERLSQLGPVNLIALQEYEELLKKNLFLSDQKNDLLKSKKELLKIISHLDKICGKRFMERLEEINFRFSRVFPLVFAGEGKAEARLILEKQPEEEESSGGALLGVDIAVRPPGKKLQSVSLLSKGEKALTAICLIYSLFLVKPSPFCVLDEVDAPLDDANNFRFLSVLKQMAEKSKIIAITHNKRTMEACGRLYGVTMREAGVSQVVSVDLGKTETLSS